MSDRGNKLLFIENSSEEVRLIEETLKAAGEDQFEILNVSRLEDAVARFEAEGIKRKQVGFSWQGWKR